MDIDYQKIGKRIKYERTRHNISQMLLAEKAELSVPYISYVETGKKKISLRALLQIANALDTTPDTFLTDILVMPDDDNTETPDDLLADCTDMEKAIISDTICALKYSMRFHKL